jgi:hypothetical protein
MKFLNIPKRSALGAFSPSKHGKGKVTMNTNEWANDRTTLLTIKSPK